MLLMRLTLKTKISILLLAIVPVLFVINFSKSTLLMPQVSAAGQCVSNDARCASCENESQAANNCITCAAPGEPAAGNTVYCSDPSISCSHDSCDLINKYVNPLISLLTAVVGVVAVASIIYGGIMYATSTGDPQKAAKARGHLVKTVLGLVGYVFFYAFIQFLIPGGILNR